MLVESSVEKQPDFLRIKNRSVTLLLFYFIQTKIILVSVCLFSLMTQTKYYSNYHVRLLAFRFILKLLRRILLTDFNEFPTEFHIESYFTEQLVESENWWKAFQMRSGTDFYSNHIGMWAVKMKTLLRNRSNIKRNNNKVKTTAFKRDF